jgi:hypothetical protein
MSGCIGVPSNDTGRYSAFSASIGRLSKPPDTEVYFATGSERVIGRNRLVRTMLEANHDWMLFLDDDSIFDNDLLERLLSHNAQVVGALYLYRSMPFTPACFTERTDEGFLPIRLEDHPQSGLVPVEAVGTGGMLVRRTVFEQLEDPWFKQSTMSEDLLFCREVSDIDIQIYCDLGARLGHMTTTAIWPSTVEDKWAIGFTVSEQLNFYRPLTA